jgi:mono/diheme cytochrome c family protein
MIPEPNNTFSHLVWSAAAAVLFLPPASANDAPRAVMPASHRLLLEQHCFGCHNAEAQEGSVRLDDLPLAITDVQTAERWQKVLNVLNAGEMPPQAEPQPVADAKADFLDALSNVMVAARKSLADTGGTIVMRRLNRREYSNTLRELLGVEINVAELPADTSNGGFDTVGANLFMSGNQFEQYRALGREALDEAFTRRLAASESRLLRYEAEMAVRELVRQEADGLDAEARAKRWIAAVEAAAAQPENHDLVAELRKTSKTDAEFRRSWRQIKGAPPPEDFGFRTVEENSDKANRAAGFSTDYYAPYRETFFALPHLDTGTYLTCGTLSTNVAFTVPHSWPPGEYVVRVRVAAVPDAPAERRFIQFGTRPRAGQALSTHEVTGTFEHPQVIEIPFTFTRRHTDTQDRTVFIREKGTNDHYLQTRIAFNAGKKVNGIGPPVAIWVDWLEVERIVSEDPLLPPGLDALAAIPLDDGVNVDRGKLVPHDVSPDMVRSALEQFCVAAFRGEQPTATYVDRLVHRYDARRKAGDGHASALKDALSLVLASPMFLYIAEPDPAGSHRRLTGPELASRLSYFLWGAPPDDRLRQCGADGTLLDPATLAAETDRLLDDPRVAGFIEPFLHQWLVLERLDFFEFNRDLYPRFDASTKMAARGEVFATFQHLLANDGSLRDLLASDYVVINSVLARYYGIDGVEGDHFRPVKLPAGSPRGGLLGMAAVLAMGSNGESTSPVERGAWVLRKLLDDAPPPAPANVPQIARLAGKTLTTRERLALHQDAPQCASCHRKIDPIGLGLENFDAVGQWRTEDSYQARNAEGKPDPAQKKLTWQVDPAGAFHQGPSFTDFFELREIIAGHDRDFSRGLAKALVEYALGRPCGFSDEPLVVSLVEQSAARNFGFRTLIHALVASDAFHTK